MQEFIAKPVLLIFVVCYFVILVGMGIYCSKEAKNSEDFILAGKGLGPVSFSLYLPWARLSYCLLCPGRSENFAHVVSGGIIALAMISICAYQYKGLACVLNATTGMDMKIGIAIAAVRHYSCDSVCYEGGRRLE